MHAVLREILHAHRLEGACADVQGHAGNAHAALVQAREQGLVEVQPGGGRGHRAGVARIDRLVAPLVLGIGRMRDVRRQRQHAFALEHVQHRRIEAQQPELAVALEHLGPCRAEQQPRARARRLARAQLRQRLALAGDALDQHLHAPAAGLGAAQARAQDAGVVEHQQVARREQPGQRVEAQVGQRTVRHVQQARGGTLHARMLRDQLGRQLEVEVGQVHGAPL